MVANRRKLGEVNVLEKSPAGVMRALDEVKFDD